MSKNKVTILSIALLYTGTTMNMEVVLENQDRDSLTTSPIGSSSSNDYSTTDGYSSGSQEDSTDPISSSTKLEPIIATNHNKNKINENEVYDPEYINPHYFAYENELCWYIFARFIQPQLKGRYWDKKTWAGEMFQNTVFWRDKRISDAFALLFPKGHTDIVSIESQQHVFLMRNYETINHIIGSVEERHSPAVLNIFFKFTQYLNPLSWQEQLKIDSLRVHTMLETLLTDPVVQNALKKDGDKKISLDHLRAFINNNAAAMNLYFQLFIQQKYNQSRHIGTYVEQLHPK